MFARILAWFRRPPTAPAIPRALRSQDAALALAAQYRAYGITYVRAATALETYALQLAQAQGSAQ